MASRFERNWPAVKVGMTVAEVAQLIPVPAHWNYATVQSESYGLNGHVLIIKEGKVAEKR